MTTRSLLPIATGRRAAAALWEQARRRPLLLIKALLTAAAASVSAVLAPLLLGGIVDAVIAQAPARDLLLLVAGLVGSALAAGVLLGLASRYGDQLGLTMAAALREDVMDRALQLDSATLEAAGAGDVASRVTEDVELINTSVEVAAGVFLSLVTVIVTAVGFVSLDWRLALAFCVVFPIHALGLRMFLPVAGPLYAQERKAAAHRTQTVLSVLHGTETVRAYGMAAKQSATVDLASRQAISVALKAMRVFLRFSNLMNGAEAVGLSAVLVTGFFLVRDDAVTVGAVTAAALLFHRLFGPLGDLLMSFDEVQRAGSALTRLVGVADLPAPIRRPETAYPRPVELRATGVSHRYRTGDEVLHDIDVAVPAGRSLAIVGESGAGKTTLAALLGGVFGASAGQIIIGAESIADLDPVQLRRRVGVVTQEVHTFVGTLGDDLRLARPDAEDADLLAALRVVGAEDWVRALPDGLQTVIGSGGRALTSDQAQQVALARLVLVDPPVMILDEATAEAGSAGARQLERAARAALARRTSVVVAHRLTQARECDEIALMAHGRIVERGTHEELVAAGGAYATLWAVWNG